MRYKIGMSLGFLLATTLLLGCKKSSRPYAPRFVYVPIQGTNSIIMCNVNSTNGQFYNCLPGGFDNFVSPTGVTIQNISGQSFAYVSNFGVNTVTQCEIDELTGRFTGCVDSGGVFINPSSTTFLTLNAQTYVYVNNSSPTISKCLLNSTTGRLTICQDSGVGDIFNNSYPIAFYTTQNQIFAYVPEGPGSNNITQCSVDSSNGSFFNCKTVILPVFGPVGIAFRTIQNQNYAYIAESDTKIVSRCQMDANGNLIPSSCANSGATGFNKPFGITFAEVNNETFAYIPNNNADSVSQCKLDTNTGNFLNCIDSGAGSIFNDPNAVSFL